MKDIQQLIKRDNQEGKYKDIFPKTFIDAVKDRESGKSLIDILSSFNMYFLSYNGSREQTRLQVPMFIRKTGLWITYVLYDKTVVTEWYAGEAIDDDSWKNLSNWRDGTNSLVGDISISSDGYWVVNGVITTTKAQGEQGITPILRVGSNNHLQASYTNGSSWVDVSTNPVYTQFRINNNKLEQSVDLGQTWTVVSDYIASWFRFTRTTGSSQADNVGKIQISRDNGVTWSDLSEEFTNSLHIKGYVATVPNLPSTAVQGDIYGVGPTYDPSDTEQTNPIYQLYVKDSTGWINNGRFTSIAAGVVQETGNSETEVMSQKAVSNLTGLNEYETFSGTENYLIGDVINYNGILYSFIADHSAGAWLGIDVEETSIKKETDKKLTELESDTNTKLINLNKKVGGFSQKEVDEEGLYLCNEKGEVLLRLDILDTKNPIGDNMISCITKHVKKEIILPCIEDGFYICNENGEVIAQYKNNEWQFIGIEIKKEVKINPCYSSLGLESGVIKADTLSNGELVLTDYPQFLKRNATVSFGATISTFSQVKVGVKGGYFCLAQIDSTNISIIHNTGTIKTEAHGLNISGWIDVVLKVEELNVEISIHSLDGYKKITATLPFRELYGRPTLEVDENTTLTDVSLRGYCDDFQKSIWFVGDSYTSCTKVRWTGQMLEFGINNWMLLGVAGGKSKDLYEDLLLALKYGTPTYLVWCMGMNDKDNSSLNTDYKKYFELVKAKCDELGVVMIPATVPCVKTSAHPTYAVDNSYKNAFIKASGLRYVDLAKAVGGDTFTDDAWYEGYLETKSPWIHTTELGAKAQMAQIIRDFPEILRNK